jgi:hypothetical protein
MKKLTFIIMVLTAMFVIIGCPDVGGGGGGKGGGGPGVYPAKKFWAQNAVTQAFYQLDAEMLASNTRCEVWAEKGSGVTAATANSVASEYANSIYSKMIGNFGWTADIPLTNGQTKRMNTLEFAHALATGEMSNAKLTILLLDIQDGFNPPANNAYVGGYFWPYDIFSSPLPAGYKTNKLDMIYIDTYPGLNDTAQVYMTLAHELQHLMNFASTYQYRLKSNTLYTMDTWIDEGLSSAAEWVYRGAHNTSRTDWFKNNGEGSGKIDVGNNFYVWGNRATSSDQYPILDDYATVYLFFQWLRLQAGSTSIYKNIIQSTNYDNQAVFKALSYSSWEAMLKDWLAANMTNSASGRDGYKGDATLKNISAPYAPSGTTSLSLYPGEGAYSYYTTTPPSTSPSGNIKYVNLSEKNTLLTYNVNTAREGSAESGQTTGIKPSVIVTGPGSLSLQLGSSVIPGPFPIGMGDVIRMNNNSNRFDFDISKVETVSDE